MLHLFLPRSLMTKIEQTVEAVRARWESLSNRQLDLMEAELAERQSFTGVVIQTKPVNRIEANGRHKAAK